MFRPALRFSTAQVRTSLARLYRRGAAAASGTPRSTPRLVGVTTVAWSPSSTSVPRRPRATGPTCRNVDLVLRPACRNIHLIRLRCLSQYPHDTVNKVDIARSPAGRNIDRIVAMPAISSQFRRHHRNINLISRCQVNVINRQALSGRSQCQRGQASASAGGIPRQALTVTVSARPA
jgi:hypothetical protein